MKRFEREKNMARQNKLGIFCYPARQTRWNIIPPRVRVNDFDVVFADEFRNSLCAQNAERISQGDVQNVFRR